MNEIEFIQSMQKNGYTYEQFGKMVRLVKSLGYVTFFSNINGKGWPEDPEAFLEDMNEQYESDDPVADALQNVEGHEDETMILSDAFAEDIATVDDFFEKWEEETGKAYKRILTLLSEHKVSLEDIEEKGKALLAGAAEK